MVNKDLSKATTRMRAHDRRRQLLDVATNVFAERGFSATIMDDIAFAGGITKPVLYQHFDSKRALYIAVLEDGGSRLIDSISIATRKSSTLREQVTLGFDAYFNFVRDDEAAFRLLFTSSSKSDTDFVVVKNKVLEQFCDHVTSLVIDQIEDEERRLIAHAIIGMAESAAKYFYLKEIDSEVENITEEQFRKWVSDLAWKGMRGINE
ncbi:MAG: TetR/AcrR family transcriptional regulator [Acidimicrobiia bacterium]|nr:TetR/AcrR family transcriptional regulator [Acidimicrobiia bacterium]